MSTAIDGPVDVPPEVVFRRGVYTTKGLRLATFSFQKKEHPPKAVVYLAHGYASHTCFDWLLPAEPGARHELYQGSVVEGLVEAGFAVRALDHTGHGHSAGAPRCFFERYQDLVDEAEGYLRDAVKQEPECAGLPVFIFGLSMGGATAVRMALQAPDDYKGLVLYAPMLSLSRVKQTVVVGPVRNAHLEPIAGCVSAVAPQLPIAAPALNVHNPLAQQEMDQDALTYSGSCRARVAHEFIRCTDEFMNGGLVPLRTPFVTFHAPRDTFTDPSGSAFLVAVAASPDKTYLTVGPGADVDVDMWHALAAEPGREIVFARAREWLLARLV